jgi:hypothetical protein
MSSAKIIDMTSSLLFLDSNSPVLAALQEGMLLWFYLTVPTCF